MQWNKAELELAFACTDSMGAIATQNNNPQNNDNQHYNIQHNDTQFNDIWLMLLCYHADRSIFCA